ncbi:MAG: ABC transporter ATP-binding protein/permease, partial [Defluviitaleaceae bacterium]|nr:ABC transporter ATP-binding protein/permease [Defluviitaleaceae bacterium]
MKPIFPYWLKYKKQMLFAFLFLTLESICDLAQPTIVSLIIDDGIKNNSLETVIKMGSLMFLVAVFGAANAIGRCVISSRTSQNFGADIRSGLYKKICSFSFAARGKYETASLVTRLTNDSSQLTNFTNGIMRVLIKAPILLCGAVFMVLLLNIKLAPVLLVIIPIIIALIYFGMKAGFPYFEKMQKALDNNNAVIREYLSGVRVVKAYNTFDEEVARFGKTNKELTGISIAADRVMGAFSPAIALTLNLGIVAALWLARGWVAEQDMQIGQIVAFINYMTQILFSLNIIFNIYQQFIRARASADRVGAVLTERGEESGGECRLPIEGGVKFENVSFAYNDRSAPALTNVSFELKPGETLGIIGSTGSGKTTLAHLLMRFYDPTDGKIYVDGTDAREYETAWLRSHFALVSQQNMLFYGEISENIRMGNYNASDAEIKNAAANAQAHDFISSFANGYQSMLGQKGVNVSGGQKQRISIARALIKKSKLLILDDCVSAVDAETEARILQAVRKLKTSPACIMITQRVSSIMRFNNILVLDEGHAVGFGSHSHLME